MTVEVDIQNLSKRYGAKEALKNINLHMNQGMFGLLGPNGAGKTTLMKVLTTLTAKTEGDVKVCGVPVENAARVRSLIGYLPQDFSMYGSMTAQEALDYLAVLSGLNRAQRKKLVPEMLEKVNLSGQKRTRVRAMSGGMRRRLGIAQAIIHDPKVIVVDEPTAGLDPEERVRFRNLLCEIARERLVILSTHIVGDIEATCEEIAVLNEGRILYQGKVVSLLDQVAGKVFSAEVSAMELPKLQEQFMVTGILNTGRTASIKIVSDSVPFQGARPIQADVEDAYLYLMHGGRGDK